MMLLLVGAIALPLLAGVYLAITARWLRAAFSRWMGLGAVCVAALCGLGLISYAGQDPMFAVTWLPGMGEMTLDLGATGLYAAVATACAALLALLGTTSRDSPCEPMCTAVILITLAAASVAFLAGHFLLRYAALEIVALGVALAPLVELKGDHGARLTRLVYLLLRIGDAGLLAAILILFAGSGTLEIGPALQAGETLDGASLRWAVLGLILAVWFKLGGWPFSLWPQAASFLSLRSRTWLYATVMPNLGLYLLYRVAPLLVLAGPVRDAAMWIGAGSALLAALVALLQPEPSAALSYLWAVQGGLALLVGATGSKVVVWLALLAVTPLRLLLHLAADLARSRLRTGMLALGGAALAAWSVLTAFWTRAGGASSDALLVAEAAVTLVGVWAARTSWRALSGERTPRPEVARTGWPRWAVSSLLGGGVLVVAAAFEGLLHHLVEVGHGTLPTNPTIPALLRYGIASPAMWIVLLLVVVIWRMQWRPQRPVLAPSERLYDLEEGLARIAQVLRAIIEVDLQEDLIVAIVQAVVSGAAWTRRVIEQNALEGSMRGVVRLATDGAAWTRRVVEQGALEGSMRGIVRLATHGGRFAYRVIEQEGLEGLLRRMVSVTLELARAMQRWHRGKLRRNLVWVALSLAVVMLFVLVGW
jgi:formate hydrogenlyase subunit 3/multisubunit Na+/H+ antiporter MnhD subunit